MAHSFLKKMMDAESKQFQMQIFFCILGAVLLLNSVVAVWLYRNSALGTILAMASAILLGAPLILQAFKDLWRQKSELNELAALSVMAAFSLGEYQTSALVAFFMLLTQLVEYRSQLGARKNIESLMRLSPNKAQLIEKDREISVDSATLRKRDLVRVRPGDGIPGDGIVMKGRSSVNEAAITGESMPADKKPGDTVFSGSLNISGSIEVEISSSGTDTTLSKIKDLIMQAEGSRTELMCLIDRYASWYTPLILALASCVLFFTRDMNRAISILIIACPCTILLSSPSALVAALSAAARLGIIIKNISLLEKAHAIDAIIFDKTGTLTSGTMKVSRLVPASGVGDNELLSSAASVEFHSRHPVAKAILKEAVSRGIELTEALDVKEFSGSGIEGKSLGVGIFAGRAEWLAEKHMSLGDLGECPKGITAIHIASDKKYLGSIWIEDSVRENARDVIADLRGSGVEKIIMLTGDRRAVGDRIAAEIGCEAESEVLPDQKMRRVEEIKKQGYSVAVVGDGVNDAPALAAGDVSIAMGAGGSDVAIHSASIVLMNDKLDRIPFLIKLSHATISVLRQNLIFTALYILALLIMSSVGMIHPVIAVLLHSASALLVVFNSARLLRQGEELA